MQIQSAERGSHVAVFGKGFLLNIFNPYVIMFWLSVSVSIGREHFGLALAGLVCGILSWITLFALAVYKSRAKISDRAARAFAYISALILLFFALKLIYAVIVGEILN